MSSEETFARFNALSPVPTRGPDGAVVVYHREKESWWAECERWPGFTAIGSSFEEVSDLVREAFSVEGIAITCSKIELP